MSESIPSIWYYETDECSLTNITGQSVQISNRVQRRSSRRVHDDYIILLCGKENEDDFELNGIGRIIIDSLDYSNISISGESLGIQEGTKKAKSYIFLQNYAHFQNIIHRCCTSKEKFNYI